MYNVTIENNSNLKQIINYINRSLELSEKELEAVNEFYLNQEIGKFQYFVSRNSILGDIRKCESAIKALEDLGSFKPTGLYVYHIITEIVNSILPLLEEKDKYDVTSVFYSAQNKARLDDSNKFKEIESANKIIKDCLNESLYIEFLKILKEQETVFKNYDYHKDIHFNKGNIDDSKFISAEGKHTLDIINKLINADILDNKYIKNNIDKIRNAYITIGKLTFINSKIEDLLIINDNTSNIDFDALKLIVTKIREKNIKSISDAYKILKSIDEKDLHDKFANYLREISDHNNKNEKIELYSDLTYKLILAERNGNHNEASIYRELLNHLKVDLAPIEKEIISYNIEQEIKNDEENRLYDIQKKDFDRQIRDEEKERLFKLREEAISELIRNGRINSTEKTIAENGEIRTVVADRDAQEQLISDEIGIHMK